jgi:hypothetical protein
MTPWRREGGAVVCMCGMKAWLNPRLSGIDRDEQVCMERETGMCSNSQ